MHHLMLDLETMSTRPNAAIAAIGAVMFDPNTYELGNEFYVPIDLESSQDWGLHISASTVKWWLLQTPAAQVEIAKGSNTLQQALELFSAFCTANCALHKIRIWGNGADFDNVILGNAYDVTNNQRPWYYSNNRCFRTLKATLPNPTVQRLGVYHHALDDAKYQTLALFEMLKAGRAQQPGTLILT